MQGSKTHSVVEVFRVFLRLGLTSFGGPVAHIGYFRKELVERRGWLSESQFTQLFAICQFLPGPASSQLGFSLGLLRAGWPGALAAFVAFTLPSAVLLLVFASVLPLFSTSLGESVIHGLKLVAFAVVADALWGMSKKLCPDRARAAVAVVAACILLLVGSAGVQLLVVLLAGVWGAMFCRVQATADDVLPTLGYGSTTAAVLLVLFFAALLLFPVVAEPGSLSALAAAFYQAGALVFGGGHVVLPLLQDSIVGSGWVSPEDFLAGYGAAQAIPGPMFAFSAYLGAVAFSGQGAVLAAVVALVFMFLPGFLLLAGVLPLWGLLAQNTALRNAIAGVNAAVVGVLGAALYTPIFSSAVLGPWDLALGVSAWALIAIGRVSALFAVLWCVVGSVLAGVLLAA